MWEAWNADGNRSSLAVGSWVDHSRDAMAVCRQFKLLLLYARLFELGLIFPVGDMSYPVKIQLEPVPVPSWVACDFGPTVIVRYRTPGVDHAI
jgi:hypothetical protein